MIDYIFAIVFRISAVSILQAGSILSSLAIIMQMLEVSGVIQEQWLLVYGENEF